MTTLIAIIQALPAIWKFVDLFSVTWTKMRLGQMDKAIESGLIDCVKIQDQRNLEHAIGNPNAGEVSGISGPIVRPSLPSVHQPTKN